MASEKKRFWRGKLPTTVWDARNDRPLCDFSKGHFTTDDQYTIGVLKKIGYIEIALDAKRPPDIVEPIQPEGTPDIRPLPAGLTEKGAAQIYQDKVLAQIEDPDGPAVPKPESKNVKKTPIKKAKKSRDLKRRK